MAQLHTTLRRKRVAELVGQGLAPAHIHRALIVEGMTNPQSGKPYSIETVRGDVQQMAAPLPSRSSGLDPSLVSEMIGRIADLNQLYTRSTHHLSFDATRPDETFWDKFRRGKAEGFEISGLYGNAITQTLSSFELGSGVTLTLAESGDAANPDDPRTYTDRQLEGFMRDNHATLLAVEEDKLALGNQWVIVNPDGSLSVASPDTVKMEHDPLDYRRIVKVTLTARLEKATVTDEYTAAERVIRIKTNDGMGTSETVRRFVNLIGEIPVVHFACDPAPNELYGHPTYEPLYRVFSRIDDLVEKTGDGVELMGNPIPVFEGVDSPDDMINANNTQSDESYVDADGMGDTRSVLKMDRLPAVILPGKGKFTLVSPARGFTEDSLNALEMYFSLICTHTRLPEFMWGMSVEQSKASTETQLPPFIQYIQSRRIKLTPYYQRLARIWLKTRRILDPKVVVDAVRVTYPEITLDEANVLLQKIIYARGMGGIRQVTMLDKLHLVPDPAKEVELARQEAAVEAPKDDFETQLNAAANREMNPTRRQPTPQRPRVTDGVPPDPDGGRNVTGGDRPVGETSGGHTLRDNGLPAGVDGAQVFLNGKRRRRRKPRRDVLPIAG